MQRQVVHHKGADVLNEIVSYNFGSRSCDI